MEAEGGRGDELRCQIDGWAEQWGVPGLGTRLTLEFSQRFRSSLGRCAPEAREVRLAAFLLDGPEALLLEALCHESAHAAVYELHGRAARPHGPEWRELMTAAGFEPRARIPAKLLDGVAPALSRNTRSLWEHRCPVCQTMRIGRTVVGRWRCAACREAGLEGELVITRIVPATGAGA